MFIKNIFKYMILIIITSTLINVSSLMAALHSVLLSVPSYPKEAINWCGPATGQMIIAGYPSGSCTVTQEDVWDEIQDNKVETMWDTDPVGLKEAMKNLCPPSGTWVVRARSDQDEIMYSIAYWMTVYNYPVAAVLNTLPHSMHAPHEEHWIVIKGIVTDVDPTTSTTINLEGVWINDPCPGGVGAAVDERFVTAGSWGSEFQQVTKIGSSYLNNYVAIIEPPVTTGKVIIPKEIMIGKLISPKHALKYAKKAIKKYSLNKTKPFKWIKKAKPLEPLLVNQDYGGYYIVPYSFDEKQKLSNIALLVNAYKGNLQEAVRFKPIKYLTKREAKRIARNYLNLDKAKKATAKLVYPTGKRIARKHVPLWEIKIDDQVVQINQEGKIFLKSKRSECCVEFESLPLLFEYVVGNIFIDNCARMRVQPFGGGGVHAKVVNNGDAGGSGQELNLNNVNLAFDFGGPCNDISLLFGEYGGHLNIDINGDFRVFDNFVDINGLIIGGVNVSVINGFGNDKGTLKLSGVINSFIIGGQELFIDNVCCFP